MFYAYGYSRISDIHEFVYDEFGTCWVRVTFLYASHDSVIAARNVTLLMDA